MQRLSTGLALLLPLIAALAACAHDADRPVESTPTAAVLQSDGRTEAEVPTEAEPDESIPEAPRVPRLTLLGSSPNDRGAMQVKGRIDDANMPGVFRLRAESGCARDVRLPTMTTGIGFAFTMNDVELGDAFACAVDAQVDDTLVATISVSPEATEVTASTTLSIDGLSVASLDLEPRADQVVRVALLSTEDVERASLRIGKTSIAGSVFPVSLDDAQASITFEVPARVWAHAILTGEHADASVTTRRGERSLEIRPSARIEVLSESDDEGC